MPVRTLRETIQHLIGDTQHFSIYTRAFHATCLFAFVLVSLGVFQNLFLGFHALALSMLIIAGSIVVVFISSRYYGYRKWPVAIFIAATFIILCINYFLNAGVEGPSLIVFYVGLAFLLSITRPSWHFFLAFISIVIPLVLMYMEYDNPEIILQRYRSRTDQFIDIGLTYAFGLMFMFIAMRFIRSVIEEQSQSVLEQSKLIEEQSKQIKESNEVLALMNERFKTLFGIISHDLRSPMSSLESYLMVLKSNPDLPREDRIMLENELLQLVKGSSSLLDNLLQWSRTQIRKENMEAKTFQIGDIVNSVVALLSPIARGKKINIHAEIPEGMHVFGNEHQTEVIVRNLIQNAIKFSSIGSEIRVQASAAENMVNLRVIDQGKGIAPEIAKNLFTEIVNPSFGTKNEKGAGIGLLLSAEFVASQGGRIWIESTNTDGTEIVFSLPKENEANIVK